MDGNDQEVSLKERVLGISTLATRTIPFSHIQRIDGACFKVGDSLGGLVYTIDIVTSYDETIPVASAGEVSGFMGRGGEINKDTIWHGERLAREIRNMIGLPDPGAPTSVEAYNTRGIKYGQKGKFDEAIAEFTEAINTYPFVANLYFNRAMAFEELDMRSEAIADYKKFIEMSDNTKLVKKAQIAIRELS